MGTEWKFDFGPEGEPQKGYTRVTDGCVYEQSRGYGFASVSGVTAKQRGESDDLGDAFCIPVDSAFLLDVPNGNYSVSVLLGDHVVPTCTTIKAGAGRLVLRSKRTSAGIFVRERFAVNVRNGQLKLAFSGIAPRLNALEIAAVPQLLTLFLAGDSTVTDQEEGGYPYAGWGQMLQMFFKHDVAVSNHAMSGRSSKSFMNEARLDAIWNEIKPQDFLFIQFGHNDQKPGEGRFADPATTYPENLKRYIDGARERDAIPVLVTSVHRRYYEADGTLRDTHGDYLSAVRKLAAEESVPLIDLADKTKALFEQLGPEGTKNLFMWGAPGEFMNFPAGVEDNTHFQERGGIEIAKLVVEEIRRLNLWPLTMYLR